MEQRAPTWTAELLWFAASRVGDEEGSVVRDQELLELERLRGVLVLCGVGDDGLCDRLADRVDLRGVATARDTDPDVDVGERGRFEDEDLFGGGVGVDVGVGVGGGGDETCVGDVRACVCVLDSCDCRV